MLLEAGQPVTRATLDTFRPDPEQKQALDAARQQFTDALMACTLGVEMSLGAPVDGVARFDKT
jgi:hypothetical protein